MDRGFVAIVDADRIHDYVFSPHQLKLIRGASKLQGELTELEIPALFKACSRGQYEVVSAGGGTLVAVFTNRDDAEDCCTKASGLFRQKTAIASATWAVAAWHERPFVAALEDAQRQLEGKKSSRTTCIHDSGTPYAAICQDCGLFPATSGYTDPDQLQRIACAGCTQRRKSSKPGLYLDKIAGGRLIPNSSFEDLARQSQPSNYLALVYLDLDRLGRYLHDHITGANSYGGYKQLVHELDKAVKDAVFPACEALCAPSNSAPPFEILLMGGDDVVLMLAAQHVFRFFDEFDRKFNAATAHMPGKLTYSAGVVWAHSQFPIAQFREHGEDLLRSAKRKKPGNSVDYAVITESLVERPSDTLARQRDFTTNGCSLLRTAKPYFVDEFIKFESTIKDWRISQLPANKVKSLYRIAFQSFEQSVLEYCFLLSRLNPTHRDKVKKFFQDGPGVWSGGPDRTTRATDLVELWDFVEGA